MTTVCVSIPFQLMGERGSVSMLLFSSFDLLSSEEICRISVHVMLNCTASEGRQLT